MLEKKTTDSIAIDKIAELIITHRFDNYDKYKKFKYWISADSIKKCELRTFTICENTNHTDVSEVNCGEAVCDLCPKLIRKKYYLVPVDEVD